MAWHNYSEFSRDAVAETSKVVRDTIRTFYDPDHKAGEAEDLYRLVPSSYPCPCLPKSLCPASTCCKKKKSLSSDN